MISARTVSDALGVPSKTLIHVNSKYRRFYRGDGWFSKSILKELEEQYWFIQQIKLFIEYLNKVENISYSYMAKKVVCSIPMISEHELGYNKCVILLVKFRAYTKRYERFYSGC